MEIIYSSTMTELQVGCNFFTVTAATHAPIHYGTVPATVIRSSNHRITALAAAARRNDPSNREPKTWYSGRVEKRLTVPLSGSVSDRTGGGGNEVRSWINVERR